MTFPRNNNFDLLRLIAALQVFIYHTLNHYKILDYYPLVPSFLNQFPGVPIFFMISGFLITDSFQRNQKSIGKYFYNRALRIFPALWVCFIFTICLLQFFIKLDWLNPKLYLWILAQISFLQTYNLEIFETWGMGVPNGSLWSIVVELQFYLFLPIIVLIINKLNKLRSVNILLICIFLTSYTFSHFIHFYVNDPYSNFKIFEHPKALLSLRILSTSVFWNIYYFILGIGVYYNFDYLRRFFENKLIIWFSIYIIYITAFILIFDKYISPDATNIYSFLELILLAFLTFSFAFSYNNWSEKLLKHNDISYGIYIYHMPVINTIIAINIQNMSLKILITSIIVINLAILSWLLIEKRVIALKKFYSK